MSSDGQPPQIHAPTAMSKRNDQSHWWRKLFSSNWWWYGEIDPDPACLPSLEKRPRLWRPRVWCGFLVCLIGVFAPTLSSLMNYDVPVKQDLQTLYGEVITTNVRNPHMQIRLTDGEVVDAEFPVFVTYFGGFKTRLFEEPVHKIVLTCKQVVVSGNYLRFVPFKRFRIWDFSCANGAFFAPRSEVQKNWTYGRFKTHAAIAALCIFGFLLMLFERFLRERKDHASKN